MDKNLYHIYHYKHEKPDLKQGENLSLFIESQLFKLVVFNGDFTIVNELESLVLKEGNSLNHDWLAQLAGLINNYRLTQRQFKSVNITVLNNEFTLMPQAYMVESNARNFLEFSAGNQQVKNTFTSVINDVNLTYTLPAELNSLLEKSFKHAAIRHSGAVCMNLLFGNASLKNADLLLNFHGGVFEIAARQDNRLLYYNVFRYETNEDILYYLLFMMEQYQLNPLICRVAMAGEIEAEGDLSKSIRKYIKHVTFAVSDKSFVNSLGDVKLPNHFYFSLLNQHLCA